MASDRESAIRLGWVEADYALTGDEVPTLKADFAWLLAELAAARDEVAELTRAVEGATLESDERGEKWMAAEEQVRLLREALRQCHADMCGCASPGDQQTCFDPPLFAAVLDADESNIAARKARRLLGAALNHLELVADNRLDLLNAAREQNRLLREALAELIRAAEKQMLLPYNAPILVDARAVLAAAGEQT